MSSFLFRNLNLLDPRWKETRPGYEVLVEGDTIREVGKVLGLTEDVTAAIADTV